MTLPFKKLTFIAALLVAFGSSAVHAQDQGWYMGIGVGQSKAPDVNCSDLDGSLGFPTAGASCSAEDTSTATKLFAGYQFNRYVAVEAGYVNLGKFTFSANKPTNPFGFTADVSDKASGFGIDAVGTWPITPEFGLLGRIGLFRWTLDASATLTTQFAGGANGSASEKATGIDVAFGVGAKYDFSENLGLRAEFQRFKNVGNDTTGKEDVDLISASFVYRFR
jgi:OmpA-OmpF porin, OOP family